MTPKTWGAARTVVDQVATADGFDQSVKASTDSERRRDRERDWRC